MFAKRSAEAIGNDNERAPLLVVVASSAGGPNALAELLNGLPQDFSLPIVIVQHMLRTRPSLLAKVLGRSSHLPVRQLEDGDCVSGGQVYLAPPDHHVYFDDEGRLRLSEAAPLHFLRPAADILFESAAKHFGGRVIAVILSGSGTDGMAGAAAIRGAGGRVIAQDEKTSAFFGMPGAAIESGNVDYVKPLNEIGPLLLALSAKAGP